MRLAAGLALSLFLSSQLAQASASEAELRQTSGKPLSGLTFRSQKLPIEWKQTQTGLVPMVRLAGSFTRENWSLVFAGDASAVEAAGDLIVPYEAKERGFEVVILLKGIRTTFGLIAVNPMGKAENVSFEILQPAPEAGQDRKSQVETSHGSWLPAVGATYAKYREDGTPGLSQLLATFSLERFALLSRQWEYEVRGAISMAPIWSSRSSVTLRFVDADLRVGYAFPRIQDPWRLSVLAGIYYGHTLARGDSLGYTNLLFPQIFPRLRRRLGPASAATFYLKAVPIGRAFSLSFKDRALGCGLGWEKSLGRHALSLSVEAESLSFHDADERAISSQRASVSVGYSY